MRDDIGGDAQLLKRFIHPQKSVLTDQWLTPNKSPVRGENFMRLLILPLLTSFALCANAFGQNLPQSVIDPYLEYQAAAEAGDNETAAEAAYRAWRAGQREEVDPQTQLALADNAALYSAAVGQFERSARASENAAELSKALNAEPIITGRFYR